MRLLQKLLLVVIFAILMAIGLDCLLADFAGLPRHPILHTFTGPADWPWVWEFGMTKSRLFGLALFALPLTYLAAGLASWQRRPGAFRVQTADGETLLLEPGALIKFARLQIENHPAVVSQRIRVRQAGNKSLAVTAHVSVRPIQSLPTIRQSIERAIRDGFSQVMGIENLDEVRIVLGLDDKSLTQRPGVLAPAEPKPEPPPRAPLTHSEEELPYEHDEAADEAIDETIKVVDPERPSDTTTERII